LLGHRDYKCCLLIHALHRGADAAAQSERDAIYVSEIEASGNDVVVREGKRGTALPSQVIAGTTVEEVVKNARARGGSRRSCRNRTRRDSIARASRRSSSRSTA